MSNRRDEYFPYHINFSKTVSDDFNPKYQDKYHKHNTLGIFRVIYKEPFAFYLTEEDKAHYDETSLRAIDVVRKIAIQQYELEQKNIKIQNTEELDR